MSDSTSTEFEWPVRAQQVFDVHRVGSTASALALVDERLRTRLQSVLREVATLTGFRVASVARLREDDRMQMIAVVGAEISVAEMEEGTVPLGIWLDSLGASGDWGRWKYCSGQDSSPEVVDHSWLPDLPSAAAADDWDPRSELACPIHDHQGRLVASLFVDAPVSGKVPPPEDHAYLNTVASLASAAVLALIASEERRLQLRLLIPIRATGFHEAAQAAVQALTTAMLVDDVELQWLLPELASHSPAEFTSKSADPDVLHALWAHDEVRRVPPRIDTDGMRHDGMLLVPVGSDQDCFGGLLLRRSTVRAPWTRTEVRSTRALAARLAQSALDHLWRTEEMHAVDALREQVAEHTRLADGVRHDIATPLSAIRNYLDLLTTAQDDPQLHQRILEALRVGTDEVQEVAQALQAFHGETITHEVVNVIAVAREVHALHSVRADQAGLTFDFSTGVDVAVVNAHPDAVRRVLGNLTVNAIKYTPAGGNISLTVTRPDPTTVRLVWRDTGIGIAPEEMPHVWDDFYRAPDPRVRRTPGSGIGLPIVARFVKEMHGHVSIDSVLDEGTSVTLDLPIAQ